MSVLFVVFKIADTEYAVPASDVVQMETYTGATHVPGAPDWVAGLMQIRANVVPVVDLRRRFGLPPIEASLDRRVVVIRVGARTVGLLVDSGREVQKFEPDAFRPPPEVVSTQSTGFVRAIAQSDKKLVLLLDCERVLGEESLHGEQRQSNS